MFTIKLADYNLIYQYITLPVNVLINISLFIIHSVHKPN